MSLIWWFFMLVLQNAAFTWVGRARASGSYGYHAIAAVFSNGIFFMTNIALISMVTERTTSGMAIQVLAMIYIAGTVTGSVLMHYIAINYLESGKRKVGG